MSKFTHRILEKANETDFEYQVIDISIDTGVYKRQLVKCKDTLIRVNNEVLGETLGSSQKPLTSEEISELEVRFNNKRKTQGWPKMELRKVA